MFPTPSHHSIATSSRPLNPTRGAMSMHHHNHHHRSTSTADVDMSMYSSATMNGCMQPDWKDPWASLDQTPRSFAMGGVTSKPLPPPKSSFSIFPTHGTLLQPGGSIWTSPAGTSPWRLRRGEHKHTISTDGGVGLFPHEEQNIHITTIFAPVGAEKSPKAAEAVLPTCADQQTAHAHQQRPTISRRSTASSISTSSVYSHTTSSSTSPTTSTSTASTPPITSQWTRSQLQLPTPDPSKKPSSSQRIRPHQYCAWCGQLGHSKPTCTDLTSALHTGKVRLEGGKIALALGRGDREETIPYPHGRGTLRDWVKRRYKELGVDVSFGGEGGGSVSGGSSSTSLSSASSSGSSRGGGGRVGGV